MGVETIVEAIGSEAAAQVAGIRSECERRVERIAEEGRARAATERQKWTVSRDEEAARKRAGIVNRARLEADRRLAEVREELFREAFHRLEGRLEELTEQPRYEDVFASLYRESISILSDPDATVLVRPEDRKLAERLVEGDRAEHVDATLSCIGGLDVETTDGRSVRNTFDSRLARAERSLRRLAVATIPAFAGSGVDR